MAKIINLRTARKNKNRKDNEIVAEQNRQFHGQSLSSKNLLKVEKAKDLRRLNQHRLAKSHQDERGSSDE